MNMYIVVASCFLMCSSGLCMPSEAYHHYHGSLCFLLGCIALAAVYSRQAGSAPSEFLAI